MSHVYQDKKMLAKHGRKDCPWSVAWTEPSGKRKSKTIGPRKAAVEFMQKIDVAIRSGTYTAQSRATWEDFERRYLEHCRGRMRPTSYAVVLTEMFAFSTHCNPIKMSAIDTAMVDEFAAKRQQDRNQRGDLLAVASVNKALRCLKAALRMARRWRLIDEVPEFQFLREPKKIPSYVSEDEFTLLYRAAARATAPAGLPFSPGSWWQALLVTLYMTGWRIGETLALKWADVDLEAGTALLRAETTKAGRDDLIHLPAPVVEQLKTIRSFGELVFPWPHHQRHLWSVFHRICEAAGVREFGFHDLRRAFASMNADRVSSTALQALMRHSSFATTQKYIAVGRQLRAAAADVYVPPVLQQVSGK